MTIRFTYAESVESKYKKARPSQVERDRKRAEERKKDTDKQMRNQSSPDNLDKSVEDIEDVQTDQISSAFGQLEAGHMSSDPYRVTGQWLGKE